MKITLQMHDWTYTAESKFNDYSADELKEVFSRLLVQATFPPSVIDDKEGGEWRYIYEEDK